MPHPVLLQQIPGFASKADYCEAQIGCQSGVRTTLSLESFEASTPIDLSVLIFPPILRCPPGDVEVRGIASTGMDAMLWSEMTFLQRHYLPPLPICPTRH